MKNYIQNLKEISDSYFQIENKMKEILNFKASNGVCNFDVKEFSDFTMDFDFKREEIFVSWNVTYHGCGTEGSYATIKMEYLNPDFDWKNDIIKEKEDLDLKKKEKEQKEKIDKEKKIEEEEKKLLEKLTKKYTNILV